MRLVREMGKPTLFITYTLEGGCDEIERDVVKKGIFGQCIAKCALFVNLQERGVPEAHCLFWIDNRYRSPLFGVISAELPYPVDPLHALVAEKMTHGRCNRELKHDSSICKRDYPKDFCYKKETTNT